MRNSTPQRPRYVPAFQRPPEPVAPPAVAPEAVDVDEAARLMSVSPSTAKRLVDSGELPSLLIGRLRRVRVEAIREYLLKAENGRQPSTQDVPQ